MTDTHIAWPQKTRELHNHHFDSTVWDDFAFRDDDIVIGTYAKSGTTWVQQIVGQLIFGGTQDLALSEMSPWLDLRVPPKEAKLAAIEAQDHRRFIKTHLPVDALVMSPKAKYLYIGRDGRDVLWSLYNHHVNANDGWYEAINETPGRVGPPIPRPVDDIRQYYDEWLDGDGYPFWPFFEHVAGWWEIRELPNVMLLHFSELKHDLPGGIRRIADFLEIEIDEAAFPQILERCTFDYMKRNADKAAPMGGRAWSGGAKTFINKGTNGRWRDVLSQEQIDRYDSMATRELGAPCAAWLGQQ